MIIGHPVLHETLGDTVFDTYHGVEVPDPFRWLEEADSPRTQAWTEGQSLSARQYLDGLPGREGLKRRSRELLDQETIGDLHKRGSWIFYSKRGPGEEQAKLYVRGGLAGTDAILLDPIQLGETSALSISILDVSLEAQLLAYGVRRGGARCPLRENP